MKYSNCGSRLIIFYRHIPSKARISPSTTGLNTNPLTKTHQYHTHQKENPNSRSSPPKKSVKKIFAPNSPPPPTATRSEKSQGTCFFEANPTSPFLQKKSIQQLQQEKIKPIQYPIQRKSPTDLN